MKLVGYIRVSTDSQADNTSLPEQRRKVEAYCTANDHELVAVFEEVGSGTKADTRPQFQKAIEMVTSHGADGLIAVKLDRIARNTLDLLNLVSNVLKPSGKALVLLDLKLDTSTPYGYMTLTVLAAMAQLERDLIYERTQGGRRVKSSRGGYAYGAPAFGQQVSNKELIPDDSELAIIELIRRHRKSGKSFGAIAKFLNNERIPTKRGKTWEAMQVKRVLDRLKARES